MSEGIPEIDVEKCIGCGDCVDWCPTGAVRLVNGKVVMLHPENCHYCTDCETVCPVGAIRCPFEIILATNEPHGNSKQQ
ncbi:MAG: 4Fe-4S binding protein [Chloroflexi bacterium]|nr:4Fe-4S binding protein [Chloroflexota bacterium]